MDLRRAFLLALLASASFAPTVVRAETTQAENGRTRYLPAIKQELSRMGIEATCDETSAACSFVHKKAADAPSFQITVRYWSSVQTVTIAAERFLEIADPAGPGLALSRRLLAANRELLAPKFEWDKVSSSIRLVAELPTDSNFDRQAFRSLVLGLTFAAAILWAEIRADPALWPAQDKGHGPISE